MCWSANFSQFPKSCNRSVFCGSDTTESRRPVEVLLIWRPQVVLLPDIFPTSKFFRGCEPVFKTLTALVLNPILNIWSFAVLPKIPRVKSSDYCLQNCDKNKCHINQVVIKEHPHTHFNGVCSNLTCMFLAVPFTLLRSLLVYWKVAQILVYLPKSYVSNWNSCDIQNLK